MDHRSKKIRGWFKYDLTNNEEIGMPIQRKLVSLLIMLCYFLFVV